MTDYSGKLKIGSTDIVDVIKDTEVNSAVNAEQDSLGQNIAETYATKVALEALEAEVSRKDEDYGEVDEFSTDTDYGDL